MWRKQLVILALVKRYECVQFLRITGLGCQDVMVRRYYVLPLNSFHGLWFRIVTFTLSVLSGQAYQIHFIQSAADTVSMALVCFLPSLPIDLLFLLKWTLSSHGLCKLAWLEIHPSSLFVTDLVPWCFYLPPRPPRTLWLLKPLKFQH